MLCLGTITIDHSSIHSLKNLKLFDFPYTQYHDSPPALLPDLTGELQGAGGGTEEGWGAVNGGHERLGQPPLLEVMG